MARADLLGRPLRTLRLSLTDRCNLRCEYCMPEDEYAWLPRSDFLSPGEIDRLVDAFVSQGVRRIRLTGGEPLLRQELLEIVERLARKPALEDLALTTNGVLLAPLAAPLRRAGLSRLTVSLDTLQESRFVALARRPGLSGVLRGIREAAVHFEQLKLDTVVVRDANDDEPGALLDFARSVGAELRFIEYMDVPGATRWSMTRLVPRPEILESVRRARGDFTPAPREPHAPAERFRLRDGQTFGVIASTTAPFCDSCDRGRVSADGYWFSCLHSLSGFDLRTPLRAGASVEELGALIGQRWAMRSDRGAEERARLQEARALVPLAVLREDPHLEMHTRGG